MNPYRAPPNIRASVSRDALGGGTDEVRKRERFSFLHPFRGSLANSRCVSRPNWRSDREFAKGNAPLALLRIPLTCSPKVGRMLYRARPCFVVSHMFILTQGSYSAIQPAKDPGSTFRSSSRRVLRTCRSESKEPTRRASSSHCSTVVERITRLISGI